MKIEKASNPLPAAVVSDMSSRASAARAATVNANAAENSGTSVHLGSASAQLRNIESNVANSSVVDFKKVAEIKQAISEGRFQVNSGVVADRLINSVQDLISASKR